ncbi:ABC transporter permease [Solidesulfovibrio fructosivorans]|nr:ABC transporter permease [Solidesulfovibrio fructosivorans]
MTKQDGYTLVIEANRLDAQYWKDLWQYRELLWMLCRRDLSVRYKQTAMGLLWAIFRPLLSIGAFTVLLGNVAKLPSEPEVPYSVLIFSGTLVWNFFSQCLTSVSSSLLTNGNLIGKVYIPRLIIPLSTIAVALVDFLVLLLIFLCVLAWFGIVPPAQCPAALGFILLAGLLALGPGIILAALTLHYRDVAHAASVAIGFGIYLSPVMYSSSLVPEKWRMLYDFNPIVGVVDGFRWAMLSTPAFPTQAVLFSCLWTVAMLWVGVLVFRRMERTFVDVM